MPHIFLILSRLAVITVIAITVARADAQSPALPDGVFDGVLELPTPIRRDLNQQSPPVAPLDRTLPAIAFRQVWQDLQNLAEQVPGPEGESLGRAAALADQAWLHFADGSPDLSHLGRSVETLGAAMALLEALPEATRITYGQITTTQTDILLLSERIARDVIGLFRRAGGNGDRLRRAYGALALGTVEGLEGRWSDGVGHHSDGLGEGQGGISFDVEAFRQELVDRLEGSVIGYAFSIAFEGQPVAGKTSGGFARTSSDSPITAQSPTKEAHVASVSKTITAIMVMDLLEQNGLSADAKVAPFLPSAWDPSPSFEELSFADVLTHQSGFGQVNAGDTYANLRTVVEGTLGQSQTCTISDDRTIPVAAFGYCYWNANFSLMRIATAGLMGFDISTMATPLSNDLTAYAFFRNHADAMFNDIGVDIDCLMSEANPTVSYLFPNNGLSGEHETDWRLRCGGFGWVVSAEEIAAIMSNLRNTDALVSPSSRQVMQRDFLGFNDPANGFTFATGAFGVYYMHGGDWFGSFGEMHTCAAAFPIQLEVGLIINSATGGLGGDYQCTLLKDAFENAWVAN
ncbi:MAG: serine hydrolase [Pseudomonadota bacterium]